MRTIYLENDNSYGNVIEFDRFVNAYNYMNMRYMQIK